jgi:hypothetical protein
LNSETIKRKISSGWEIKVVTGRGKIILFLPTSREVGNNEFPYKYNKRGVLIGMYISKGFRKQLRNEMT